MNILSFSFFVFFLLLFLFCSIMPKWKRIIVFVANLFFSLFLGIDCFIILNGEILISFFMALLSEKIKESYFSRRVICLLSLLFSVGPLLFYKLCSFNFSFLNIIPGVYFSSSALDCIAPVGLAYYSLSITGYLIDVYKAKTKPEHSFVNYYVITGFFLRLFQGPIFIYSSNCSVKLSELSQNTYTQITHGAQKILWGLYKKLVIADWLAIPVSFIFDNETIYGSIILYGSILFYIQLYCDFSGCIDIVSGCAEMIGFSLPENFMHPFFSTSVIDFWHRWHITLSDWLKNYIYIPLGGSQRGNRKTFINIFIVFVVSGLWHGSQLTFLFWGCLHAVLQIISRCLKKSKLQELFRLDKFSKIVLTFFIISITWIPFRSPSFSISLSLFKSVFCNFQFNKLVQNFYSFGISKDISFMLLCSVIILFGVEYLQEIEHISIRLKIDGFSLFLRWTIYICLICCIVIFGHYGPGIKPEAFIYEHF